MEPALVSSPQVDLTIREEAGQEEGGKREFTVIKNLKRYAREGGREGGREFY